MNSRTHKVRLDLEGEQMVEIVIGCVEVAPIDGAFRLLAVTRPYGAVVLPRKYFDLGEAQADCDLLNSAEHPVSFPDRFRAAQHTISSSLGA